jgi:hypothetical protein
MVFSTTNLFKTVGCPYGEACELTNCIFSHDPHHLQNGRQQQTTSLVKPPSRAERDGEPPVKRRKVTYESLADKPASRADLIRSQLATDRSKSSKDAKAPTITSEAGASSHARDSKAPPSLTRSVSPPATNGQAKRHSLSDRAEKARSDNSHHDNNTSPSSTGLQPPEPLQPRRVAHDPAGYAKRSFLLKHLHGELVRLNRMVSKKDDLKHRDLLVLSEQELIKIALDEEEKIATTQSKVYENILKQRISFYRKMKIDDWSQNVKKLFVKDQPKEAMKPVLETGLTSTEELLLLPHLVVDQSNLAKYGYIPTPPTAAEAAEAQAAVEASKNFEVCERCGTRFQVFPERDSEGRLTSAGHCMHHPNKKVYPQRTKGDVVSGLPKEAYYPCCHRVVGSPGCTAGENHVFKSSNPARLAAVLPFIITPENPQPQKDKRGRKVRAVTFDCEMGYTVYGMELIRITAISWPDGEPLLDLLVRPLGAVIDLNSRFSGVWPESYANAVPYEKYIAQQTTNSLENDTLNQMNISTLPVVDSPQKAREHLCSFLTPQTPLLGHAIDNDLNAVRLCHPTIVDTVILFSHPRGLPMRFGLKMLTSKHLNRNIQNGGDRGHDSFEDAEATGDLVRFKAAEKWRLMSAQGWKFADGELVPPPPAPGQKGVVEQVTSIVVDEDGKVGGTKRKKNRKGSDSTDDEVKTNSPGLAAYAEQIRRESEGGKV